MIWLKIIVTPYRANGSGMTTYSEYLAMALSKAGAEVSVIGFGPEPKFIQSWDIHYVNLGDDPEFLNYLGGPALTYLYIRKKVANLLEHLSRDVEIINFTYPGATTRSKNTKTLTTAWGYSTPLESISDLKLNVSPKIYSLAALNYFEHYFMDKGAYARSDAIIGTTSETVKFWKMRVKGLEGKYLPVPVEYEPVDFLKIEINADEKVNFLMGERDLDRPRNNVIPCLNAFEVLYKRGLNNFCLSLVGKAGYRTFPVIHRMKNLGVDVRLYEYMDKVSFRALLDQNDVALIPRHIKDQGGYWPLEAMAKGSCAIALRTPAFEDFVIDGESGILVDSSSLNDIAQAIGRLLIDYDFLNRLKKGALAQIEKTHSLKASGLAYLNYYRYVLENCQ